MRGLKVSAWIGARTKDRQPSAHKDAYLCERGDRDGAAEMGNLATNNPRGRGRGRGKGKGWN